MALRPSPPSSWTSGMDFPSQFFETGRDDYELYEEDDEFVLSVEMPGFDPEDIDVTWNDGVLNVAAERTDESRNRRRTYHRRFRFPKTVADEDISAQYRNGILEIRLPVLEGATTRGTRIEIEH
ncbi:Hsp20/alpha crystallin family protein [Haloplanus halophilus]|uniref:Hsp20/alpha crystallin family protein n=1 Tax=Haloplanus halophilus TaxID=2949993 RepID=UPI00203C2B1D|nr:Hsp20/alpha crystallin family protein [Haloplanus sp. GDY1]